MVEWVFFFNQHSSWKFPLLPLATQKPQQNKNNLELERNKKTQTVIGHYHCEWMFRFSSSWQSLKPPISPQSFFPFCLPRVLWPTPHSFRNLSFAYQERVWRKWKPQTPTWVIIAMMDRCRKGDFGSGHWVIMSVIYELLDFLPLHTFQIDLDKWAGSLIRGSYRSATELLPESWGPRLLCRFRRHRDNFRTVVAWCYELW